MIIYLKTKIPFGKSSITANLPENTIIVRPNDIAANQEEVLTVRKALANPIRSPKLRDLAKGKKEVAIVINDITRLTPSESMVSEIHKELKKAGIRNKDITVIVATGDHRPNTHEELIQMLGQNLVNKLNIINHKSTDTNSLIEIGETTDGIPIVINKHLARASLKILTGLITPHHLAGYSGGPKSLLPGVASRKSLEKHHSFPFRPYEPAMGMIKDNPFYKSSLEAAQIVGVDFIMNAIPNNKNEMVEVVAGDVKLAHQKGVKISEQIWKTTVSSKVDITITSPGGYPKDINLHQAQKAISPAEIITKKNGTIILVAECRDGIGKFEPWLTKASNPGEIIGMFRKQGWKSSSGKAFLFARALSKFNILILTHKIKKTRLNKIFLKKVNSIDEAINKSKNLLDHKNPKVALIPHASHIIPVVNHIVLA